MRATILGGFIYRSGIGAMPFLLPLLLQLGFDLTAFQSGLITLSSVVGAMGRLGTARSCAGFLLVGVVSISIISRPSAGTSASRAHVFSLP